MSVMKEVVLPFPRLSVTEIEIDVSSRFPKENDILIIAIYWCQLEVIRDLLKRDSMDINGKNACGNVPLLDATFQGYADGLCELF